MPDTELPSSPPPEAEPLPEQAAPQAPEPPSERAPEQNAAVPEATDAPAAPPWLLDRLEGENVDDRLREILKTKEEILASLRETLLRKEEVIQRQEADLRETRAAAEAANMTADQAVAEIEAQIRAVGEQKPYRGLLRTLTVFAASLATAGKHWAHRKPVLLKADPIDTKHLRSADGHVLTFWYRNHKDDLSERHVIPTGLRYGAVPGYYPEPQWFLEAFDLDKEAPRTFAVSRFTPDPNVYTHLPGAGLPPGDPVGPPSEDPPACPNCAGVGRFPKIELKWRPATKVPPGMEWVTREERPHLQCLEGGHKRLILPDRDGLTLYVDNYPDVPCSSLMEAFRVAQRDFPIVCADCAGSGFMPPAAASPAAPQTEPAEAPQDAVCPLCDGDPTNKHPADNTGGETCSACTNGRVSQAFRDEVLQVQEEAVKATENPLPSQPEPARERPLIWITGDPTPCGKATLAETLRREWPEADVEVEGVGRSDPSRVPAMAVHLTRDESCFGRAYLAVSLRGVPQRIFWNPWLPEHRYPAFYLGLAVTIRGDTLEILRNRGIETR